MFSSGSSRRADLDLFLEGVRFFEGVDTLPFPLSDSSLSALWSARAAFCRRVRALMMNMKVLCWVSRTDRWSVGQELVEVGGVEVRDSMAENGSASEQISNDKTVRSQQRQNTRPVIPDKNDKERKRLDASGAGRKRRIRKDIRIGGAKIRVLDKG